jgi:hypothetical protein
MPAVSVEEALLFASIKLMASSNVAGKLITPGVDGIDNS